MCIISRAKCGFKVLRSMTLCPCLSWVVLVSMVASIILMYNNWRHCKSCKAAVSQ